MIQRLSMAEILRARGKLGPYGNRPVPAEDPAPPPDDGPDPAAVRAWAAEHGIKVSPRGRIPAAVLERYRAEAS